MPYVTESSSDPDALIAVRKKTVSSTVGYLNGRTRSQYGYRTRDLSRAEELGIRDASLSGNITSLIAHYEEVGHGEFGKPDRAYVVHERDYSEARYTPATHYVAADLYSGSNPATATLWDAQGAMGITGVRAGIVPTFPSKGAMSAMAAPLLRQTAPSQHEINLTRSLGELKDFPSMMKASKLVLARDPHTFKNPKAAAGQFLNVIFGVQPTMSDLQKMSETVIRASPILDEYIRQERVRLRRKGTRVLGEYSNSGTYVNEFGYTPSGSTTFGGDLSMHYSYVLPTSSSSSADVLKAHVNWSVAATQRLVTSATYEYYIPQPEGFQGRMDEYSQLAQRLVGGGANAETIYDLTPYSWLVDWFFDIGGVIAYQQNLADNQMIAIRKSFSVIEQVYASARIVDYTYDSSGVVGAYKLARPVRFNANTAIYRWKRVQRGVGNPYSVTPTWSFSKQQWAIAAAMGLSRSEGVPTIRGG